MNIRGIWCSLKESELFVPIKIVSMTHYNFINSVQDYTKIGHTPSTNRHLVAMTADWIKEHISRKIGMIHDCYVAWTDAARTSAISVNTRFRKMFLTVYDGDTTKYCCSGA